MIDLQDNGLYKVIKADPKESLREFTTELNGVVEKAGNNYNKNIVFDLQFKPFLYSSDIGVLAGMENQAKKSGVNLAFTNIDNIVLDLLKLSCLDRVLNLYPTMNDYNSAHEFDSKENNLYSNTA